MQLQVTATGLPGGWSHQDIGSVPAAGSATYNAGTFTASGTGLLSGYTDSLHYTYTPMTGDGAIIARVATSNYSGQAWVGVMIRESLTAGSKHVLAGKRADVPFLSRLARVDNGDTYEETGSEWASIPMWVKLERQGNLFRAYGSSEREHVESFSFGDGDDGQRCVRRPSS